MNQVYTMNLYRITYGDSLFSKPDHVVANSFEDALEIAKVNYPSMTGVALIGCAAMNVRSLPEAKP